MRTSDVVPADKPEFVLQRVFGAPRELVYKIWTEPEYVRQWWGVHGSTITRCEMDVRTGGAYRIDMKASDGTIYVNRGVYSEVVVNLRLASYDVRDGDAGTGSLPAGTGSLPAGTHCVTFEDAKDGTLVTLVARFEKFEDRDIMVRFGMIDGIRESFDRFDEIVTTLLTQ